MDIYEDGILRQRYDDDTETYYAWDENGVLVEERPYDEDALQEKADRIAAASRPTLTTLDQRVTALEEYVFGNVEDPEPDDTPLWDSQDTWPPGAIVRYPDAAGSRYRNVSGAWLTAAASPDTYPIGWVDLDVTPIGEWEAGVAYEVSDQVTYDGSTYQCIQAHTSQVTWEPPNVPALWSLVA